MSDLIFVTDGHKGYHEGKLWPSVTQVIRAAGLSRFNGVPEYNLEAARIRGKAVDKACEFIDKGLAFVWPSAEAERAYGGYVQGYRKFCADYLYRSLLHQHIVHDHEREYWGILDTFGTVSFAALPGALKQHVVPAPTFSGNSACFILIDRKTGPTGAETGLQLATYLRALEFPGLPEPRGKFVLRITLKLNADETYDPPTPFTSPLDERVFVSALTCANWKERNP